MNIVNWVAGSGRDRVGRYCGGLFMALGGGLLGGCHDAAPTAQAPAAAVTQAPAGAGAGVTLTPDQVATLGLITQPAARADYREESPGYGVILGHDVIAQAAAELATAQATLRQSRSALERVRKLAGTPGAVSADVEEAAAQKAEVDAAALTLTVDKLSSMLGMNPPWKSGASSATLRDLASGRLKLVRATFPLGTLTAAPPSTLRVVRLGTPPSAAGWTVHTIWEAPADATFPGRSFFALLTAVDAGEGERLSVWAPVGRSETGVLIPRGAAVLNDGQYWCYVERKPGNFVRVALDIAKAMTDGYFVPTGISAGDPVVTAAAGLLLAKELGAGAESD